MTKYYFANISTMFNKYESFYMCIEGDSDVECRGILNERLAIFANEVSDKYFNMSKIKAAHITDEEYYNNTWVGFWEVHRLEYEQGIMNLAKRGEKNGT